MRVIADFPRYEIALSQVSDGDFRDTSIFPEYNRPIRQLHGDEIYILTKENRNIPITDVDGIYTRESDLWIGSLSADCPVILLMGEDECASVHSGWRGTGLHVVQKAVSHFHTLPENIRVYIGPHIKKDSYEVRDDLFEYFPREYFCFSESRVTFDLEKFIIDDLLSLGIQRNHIITSTIDTYKDTNYQSYRRDTATGIGCISIKRLLL